MLNKKLLLPIIGAVLMALGVNLEKLGIDLGALGLDDSNGTVSSSTAPKNSSASSSQKQPLQGSPAAYQPGKKWSKTSPEINLHHVFEGEINRKGKAVGYHSRPGGVDPAGAKIIRIRDKPNRQGVYTAIIAINDNGQWKEKFSSFFPDNMSADEVTQAILNAYSKSSDKKKQPWQGPSGHGFNIQGYTTNRGGINTAFPVY